MKKITRALSASALSLSILIPALSVAARASSGDAPADAPGRPSQRLSKARKAVANGIQKVSSKDYSEAIKIFKYAANKTPRWAEAHYQLGNAYYHRAFAQGSAELADKSDAENAVSAYETAVALDPKGRTIRDPFLLYHGMAQCLDALGQYQDALAAVKKSIRLAPKNPMPHLYGARIRYKIQDYDKSAANLLYSVRRARRNQMYPQLAKLVRTDPLFKDILAVHQNKVILESYDAVQEGTLSEEEAKERIRGAEDFKDALTPTTAVRRPPSVTTPVQNPVVTKFVGAGHRAYNAQRFREAANAYQAALTADKDHGTLDAVQKSLIYERIGSSYRQLGLAGEAIRILEKSVAEMPKNSSAYYELALCYSMGGQLGTSLTFLNKALDTASTTPQLRKTVMLSKTDSELAPLRDMDRYKEIIASHASRVR